MTLPSRSGWRERLNGTDQSLANSQTQNKTDCHENDQRRNLNWGQRRTKVYHIDSDIDVHKFKIIDTIHIKRSQIEARLEEYNDNQKRKKSEQPEVLMLTYSGTERPLLNSENITKTTCDDVRSSIDESIVVESSTPPITPEEDLILDPNLDGLSLKDNTKKKMTQFAKNMNDGDIAKKTIKSPPVPKKKKYNASVDWREELKNREKAKQLEALKGFKMGMPDYKEPEKEKEEQEKEPIEDSKWGKSSRNKWERVKLKPAVRHEEKTKVKETVAKSDEPFKINLRPVSDRKVIKPEESKTATVEKKQDIKETNVDMKGIKDKPSSRRNSMQPKEEKAKVKTKNSKQDDKQYIIKVINFVAIKVPVESSPSPPRRKKIERKNSTKKPPIPKEKPPSLPIEDEIPEVFVAQEYELDGVDLEIASILEENFNSDLKNHLIEIIKESELKKANVRKEKVQVCPKPKVPNKCKDEKSFDEKYFKPRRRKILDYFPEAIPIPRRKEEIMVEPLKFSSISDNCITKSLFVGSQYVGQKNK